MQQFLYCNNHCVGEEDYRAVSSQYSFHALQLLRIGLLCTCINCGQVKPGSGLFSYHAALHLVHLIHSSCCSAYNIQACHLTLHTQPQHKYLFLQDRRCGAARASLLHVDLQELQPSHSREIKCHLQSDLTTQTETSRKETMTAFKRGLVLQLLSVINWHSAFAIPTVTCQRTKMASELCRWRRQDSAWWRR